MLLKTKMCCGKLENKAVTCMKTNVLGPLRRDCYRIQVTSPNNPDLEPIAMMHND